MHKKILALILVLQILLTCWACSNNSKNPNKGTSSNKETTSSENAESIDSDPSSDEADDAVSSAPNVKGEIIGTSTVTNDSHSKKEITVIEEEIEIIPSPYDAYKLNPMKGGSDSEAIVMRDKILKADDSLNITGKIYYVSNKGDNKNDGLSPETPFKDLTAVTGNMLSEGDAVLLERGSVFRLSGSYQCKSGVTYGAYGEGNKPAVYGSTTNFAKSYYWKPSDIKNVWMINFPFNGDMGNIVFNHGEHGCEREDFIRLLEENGDFYLDSSTNTLYVYTDKGNPGTGYYSIEIGTRMILFNLPSYNANNIHIDNICFKYSGNFAIRASINAKNITITNCEIGWIGGSLQPDGLNVYGNGIEIIGGGENISIKDNWIYQIFDSAMTFQGVSKNNGSLFRSIIFANNLMEYCGMAGIEWWTITGDSEYEDQTIVEDILFEGNITRFTGYGWTKNGERGARHIQGPWGRYRFINMRNFVIKNNIFDCALGGAYSYPFNDDQAPTDDQHFMTGNTYYQIATPNNVVNRYGKGETTATNQAEYEADIKRMEKNPKLIKWLS